MARSSSLSFLKEPNRKSLQFDVFTDVNNEQKEQEISTLKETIQNDIREKDYLISKLSHDSKRIKEELLFVKENNKIIVNEFKSIINNERERMKNEIIEEVLKKQKQEKFREIELWVAKPNESGITEFSMDKGFIYEMKKASKYTTLHGFPRIVAAENIYARLMWIIFTLLAIGFCGFMVYHTLNDYLDFDTQSKVTEVYQQELQFPAVSICNVNPLITPLASQYIKESYEEIHNVTLKDYAELLRLEEYGKNFSDLSDWFLYRTYLPDFAKKYPKYANTNAFGYLASEMILNCKFANSECGPEDFESFRHPIYGNCLKFNGNISNPLTINSQGQGLYVELFTGKFDDSNNAELFFEMPHKGMAILLDKQETMAIRKEGFLVEAGRYARMSLLKTRIDILPPPYSDCQFPHQVDTILIREMRTLGLD